MNRKEESRKEEDKSRGKQEYLSETQVHEWSHF